MPKKKDLLQNSSNWLFVAPMSGLELTEAVNFEHRVDRVTFISSSRLARRRKRLGFNFKISELKEINPVFLGDFFSNKEAFAIFRLTGKAIDLKPKFLSILREEIAILALSQLGYGRRRNIANPALSQEYKPGNTKYLLLDTKASTWSQQGTIRGKIGTLVLDQGWRDFQRMSFYYDLLRIIRSEISISRNWRNDIRNAAILAGQSQVSIDLPQSFLWNMIALELLLTEQQDRCIEALPTRAEAFIGWARDWKSKKFPDKIRELYQKRNNLVHRGKRDGIEIKDILFSDDILLNVLLNISKHPKIFNSKAKLVEFSKKVEAERLLGVNVKIRPKTLTFLRPWYRDQDFTEI